MINATCEPAADKNAGILHVAADDCLQAAGCRLQAVTAVICSLMKTLSVSRLYSLASSIALAISIANNAFSSSTSRSLSKKSHDGMI